MDCGEAHGARVAPPLLMPIHWFRAAWARGAGVAALSNFIAVSVILVAGVSSALHNAEIGQRSHLLTDDAAFCSPAAPVASALRRRCPNSAVA